MKFWTVIGRDRTRKSSTIYSLTGTSRFRESWELQVNSGMELAYVDPRSAQERVELNTPQKLLERIKRAKSEETQLSCALLAFHHERKNWPTAIEYLTALKDGGLCCEGVLFSSPGLKTENWLKQNFPNAAITSVPSGPSQPANQIANSVRTLWGL